MDVAEGNHDVSGEVEAMITKRNIAKERVEVNTHAHERESDILPDRIG